MILQYQYRCTTAILEVSNGKIANAILFFIHLLHKFKIDTDQNTHDP